MTHTIVLLNDGNVALRSLSIGALNLSSTTVNCSLGEAATTLTPVANPVPNLPVGGYLTCQSNYTFLQDVIELGDAHHVTRASAVNVVPSTSAAFTKVISLVPVAVPNNPSLAAYVHTDVAYCGDYTLIPFKARECRLTHLDGIWAACCLLFSTLDGLSLALVKVATASCHSVGYASVCSRSQTSELRCVAACS